MNTSSKLWLALGISTTLALIILESAGWLLWVSMAGETAILAYAVLLAYRRTFGRARWRSDLEIRRAFLSRQRADYAETAHSILEELHRIASEGEASALAEHFTKRYWRDLRRLHEKRKRTLREYEAIEAELESLGPELRFLDH
jgi:hypothetical protein